MSSHPSSRRGWSTLVLLFGYILLIFLIVLRELSVMRMNSVDGVLSFAEVAQQPQHHDNNNPSFKLAYQQSLGFFDYIPESDWKFRQDLHRNRIDHSRWTFGRNNSKIFYMNNYYPSFSCPHAIRIGREPGDGPKFVCDPHRLVNIASSRKTSNSCLVYSVGSQGNFMFEDGLRQISGDACEVHIFDPGNYEYAVRHRHNMYYHKWGFGSSYEKNYTAQVEGDFLSMPETVKRLGHTNRVIDILKIDCEMCEWHSFQDWLEFDVRQILVETHDAPSNAEQFFDSLLEKGYVIFSKEPNTHPDATVGSYMCVEWGFLKLDKAFSQK